MFRSLIKQSHIFKRSFSVCKDYGLDKIGIVNPSLINYNLSQEQLFTHEVKNNEGTVLILNMVKPLVLILVNLLVIPK